MSGDAQQAWTFDLTGTAWWLVLPLAAVAAWALCRLYREELAAVGAFAARGLRSLRGLAAVILVLLFLEPACTRLERSEEAPTVSVVVDASASMAVADGGMSASRQLDEAVALGLVAPKARPVPYQRAGQALRRGLEQLPRLQAALTRDGGSDEFAARRVASAELAEDTARALEDGFAGVEEAALRARCDALVALLAETAERLSGRAAELAPLAQRLAEALEGGRELASQLAARQAEIDRQLIDGGDAAVTDGLERWRGMSRFERAARFVEQRLAPALGDRAQLRITRMDAVGTPLDPAAVGADDVASLAMRTDVTAALRSVTEAPIAHLDSVLLVSDGRATTGGDPSPVARALRARGVPVHSLVLGDPEQPRDAVVAELSGSSEVYLRELVRLDVRYRVTGYGDRPWDLVLLRDGEEVERRTVTGSGRWEVERFEFRAERAGVLQLSARIEPAGGSADSGEVTGLQWESWDGIDGSAVAALTAAEAFTRTPSSSRIVAAAAGPRDHGDRYGSRLRGWVVPPQTGEYRFAIAADDGAELWLGTDAGADSRGLIASCPAWTPPDAWDQYPEQRSRPIALRQGQRYYLEVLHKESSGGDHVAVAWTLPDGTDQRPIPGTHLRPWSAEAAAASDPEAPDAEVSLDNNQADTAIVVHEDPLRVLVVDHLARWESRFLVSLFERDRRVQVTRRYRQILLPAGERQLLPDSQETLDAFDVVVLGDVRPDELEPEDQQRLAWFVQRRGGFLITIAGRRAMPHLYSLGGLTDLLPVRGHAADEIEREAGERIRVRLSESGLRHAITVALDDRQLNAELWPKLAPLTWAVRGVTIKPSATALVVSDDGERSPILAIMRSGAGRVLYCGTDETWRWRDRIGATVHQAVWLQALRWGLGARLRGSDPQLQMALDRSLAAPGDPVEVRVRATDADGTPLAESPLLLVRRADDPDAPPRVLELIPVSDGSGMWQTAIDDLDLGAWRLVATHPALDDELREVRELFVRTRRSEETVELRADPAFLRSLSSAGGGRAAAMADADELLDELVADAAPRVQEEIQVIRLWDSYGLLLVVVGLLMTEWLWRKRRGLP